MTYTEAERVDWRALWASGDLARFCFISLGILLHATNETMVATVMPAMRSRLFPTRPFDPRSAVGSGMIMVFAFSIATCSFALYGPLILTSLHGIPVLTTGYIIAAESISWSILSILVANAPPRSERTIIIVGALMIAVGIAGFAYAVPLGSVPLILFCAVLQGGGFGIAWPFVTRVIVATADPAESTVASSGVPTMQRIGYAVGAAMTGIIANAVGFSEGLSAETSAGVASWIFLAFLPLGVIGCMAAVKLTRDTRVLRKA